MDCFRCNLKIKEDKLLGKRAFRNWELIDPSEIQNVREYIGFIWVWTSKGKYIVGAYRGSYDEVVNYLKKNTKFDLTKNFIHKYDNFMYRLDMLKPIKKLFKKQPNRCARHP